MLSRTHTYPPHRDMPSGPRTRAGHVRGLSIVLILLVPAIVFAKDSGLQPDATRYFPPTGLTAPRNAALRLRTSTGADPETVWIGHVATSTGLPGTPGGYGPYHVGRGPNRVAGGIQGTAAAYNGVWDFDHFQPGEVDSLMGWWPVDQPFAVPAGTDLDDTQRPWFGLDYGNGGNYVIPQGAPKRTVGVTGYWHADGGSTTSPIPADPAAHNPVAPTWSPLSGSASAWCGLRSHGDIALVDPQTGNPFNSQVLDLQGPNGGPFTGSLSAAGTDHNYPGYGSQWDQLLYRDVTLPQNASLQLSFLYTTNMSTNMNLAHNVQTGWFDKDPLKPVSHNDGNFISSCTACGLPGVADSFMVYVGVPVEPVPGPVPNDFLASDGARHEIYDLQRRWFSEVLRIDAPGTSYRELLSVGGVQGTSASPIPFAQTVSAATLNPMLDADGVIGDGGRIRIVFRVKTNRGFDDENHGNSGFSSGTAGAALLDDVTVNGVLVGDFEGPGGGIDNHVATSSTSAWKSTGKPVAPLFHAHNLADGLPFTDPCGAIYAVARLCNMGGGVLVPGDHDLAEKAGGIYGSNLQERNKLVASPTINLSSNGAGDYNGMGIDAAIAARSIVLFGDYMANLYQLFQTGSVFGFGWQSYPVTQANGVKCWGEMRHSVFVYLTGVPGCFSAALTLPRDERLIVTSNPSGTPDSIRVYLQSLTRCFGMGALTAANCSPTSGVGAGGYFDNLSIGFVDHPPLPDLDASTFNDCFPVNSQNKPTSFFGLAYDTLAARIQTDQNIALRGGNELTGPDARENIAGDSALAAARGADLRIDLVFRILPGVGNFVQVGQPASGVARRPDTISRVAASPADLTDPTLGPVDRFWGAYLDDNGAVGTGGDGVHGPGHPGGRWDPHRWNSARMDSAESNFFPMDHIQPNFGRLAPGLHMTAYHEADPKFAVLGIAKNRCFLNKNKQPVKVNMDQIHCGDVARFGAYPPAFYTTDPLSGYSGAEISGQPGRTLEYTKILPDGQFTPGTEIQYFYRKSVIANSGAPLAILPDTNIVLQSPLDGYRWFGVSVLPDRWKDPAFGGPGMACMLVVEMSDGLGDELVWNAMADSIGLTAASKRGAHNGWRARADQDVSGLVGGDDTICRRDNGGHAGSTWDLYEAIYAGTSGGLGSRAAARNLVPGSLTAGKWTTHGPSEDMLKNYRTIVLLAPALGTLGPFPGYTDNDIGLLTSFLTLPGGSAQPRALLAFGAQFATGLMDQGADHAAFLTGFFRAPVRADNYRGISGNSSNVADLEIQSPVASAGGSEYGVFNYCYQKLSVFDAPPGGAQVAGNYENVGAFGPYHAGIYSPATGSTRPFHTLITGWTFGRLSGFGAPCPGCVDGGGRPILLNVGVRKFMAELLTNALGGLACGPLGPPVGLGDQPAASTGSAFVNYLEMASANPTRDHAARLRFGIATTGHIQVCVYDMQGRRIRTVAQRVFHAGREHTVTWDGHDDDGRRVGNGVYFFRLVAPGWSSEKRLVLLGR